MDAHLHFPSTASAVEEFPCPRLLRARASHVVSAVAIVIALVRVVITIHTFTNTIDEPFHIAGAVGLYDIGKHVYGVEHPPLPKLVAGLPLYLSGVHLPERFRTTTIQGEMASVEAGTAILFENELSYTRILHLARYATLLFAVVAMVYLHLLGYWIGGPMLGAAAVLLFSMDPNFLGHATWVCGDVPATAGFLAGLYHGARWIVRPSIGRALIAGIALALAVACKFSCALLLPVLLIFLILRRRHSPPSGWQVGAAIAVGFFVLWATYLFDIGTLGDQARFRPDSPWRRVPQWVKRTPVPMPSFGIGLLWVASHARSGHLAYLNGEISHEGWWYYFPEVLVLKSPLGLLSAIFLAIGALIWSPPRWRAGPVAAVLIAVGVYLVVSISSKINIGVRHLLPIIPLIGLLAGWQLIRARLAVVLAACIGYAAVESAMAHPNYIAFFNPIAGGPESGQRYLLDSNMDWGQDVGRLAEWLRTDAPDRAYTLRLFMFPHDPLAAEVGLDPDALRVDPHGLLAISRNVRHGLYAYYISADYTQFRDERGYAWLECYPRVKRIGYSIDVYDLDRPVCEDCPRHSSR